MDEPRVTVSDKLDAYLAKKGHRYILMSVATCKSCGGAVGELYARPVKDDEAHRLIDGNRSGLRRLPCYGPGGEALQVAGSSPLWGSARCGWVRGRPLRPPRSRIAKVPQNRVASA